MVLLTATPHSGDEEAFARLLSLIEPSFASMNFEDARYRERLARHFVQRRRIDLVSGDWDEDRAFPKHETTEFPYRLSKAHLEFQEAALDYCLGIVSRAGSGQRERRLAFWGTLALMRCVGSSPAAGLSALRNRIANESDRLEPQIYDEDGDDEDAVDIEPGTAFDADPELLALVTRAEELVGKPDPKLTALVDALTPLIKKGANPVVFCRYLATAEHVRDGLRKAFPKADRRSRDGCSHARRTARPRGRHGAGGRGENRSSACSSPPTACPKESTCSSSSIRSSITTCRWNPTRHQQREGRVDRFGQPAELVRSIMMFSPDSAIDGAVLDVILRKAEEIRKATGVTVPLPDERGPVTDALMASMMLRRGVPRQLTLDLRLDDGAKVMEARWRDAAENEKKSRARFAQNAMKPQEVAPEWEKVRTLLGSPADARLFVERAMSRFGVPLEARKTVLLAHVDALDAGLARAFGGARSDRIGASGDGRAGAVGHGAADQNASPDGHSCRSAGRGFA